MEKGSVTIRDSRYGNSDISNQHYAGKSRKALSDIVLHSGATRANVRNHDETIHVHVPRSLLHGLRLPNPT